MDIPKNQPVSKDIEDRRTGFASTSLGRKLGQKLEYAKSELKLQPGQRANRDLGGKRTPPYTGK